MDARLATIVADLRTLEIDATAEHEPRATITPPLRHPSVIDGLLAKLESDVAGRFAVERTLGEGGMGVVHLAEQVALGRKVAIKTLRGDVVGTGPIQKVLQEAWITGYLEHPNIVPVYDIARGEDGRPVIILKRIEGDALDQLLIEPRRVERRHGESDAFEWALRVVIQLCQALAYAHRNGIVHRDVKAENVMIGAHGEVYLLDWGIAVATRDDGTGRFPLASEATGVAGTPCYMAPEMLGGDVPRLGPWTDVYLLGALLFEICTGRVPHEGHTLVEIVRSVLGSPPAIDAEAEVPAEIATIIRRAMDPEPEARFENADQLRLALEGFLRHRGSRQLAERADGSAEAMRAALQAEAADEAEVAFAEARFGYRAALELWTENDDARGRLRDATEAMVRAALERDDADAAARLLATAESIDPALRAQVGLAREASAKKRAALAALEEDLDESKGRRTRAFLTLIFCAIWVGAPMAAAWTGMAPGGPRQLFQFTFALIVLTAGLFTWARDTMMGSRLNRTLAAGLLGTMASQLVITLIGWHADLSATLIRTLWLVLYMLAVLWAMASASYVLWPSALGFAVAAAGAALMPDRVSEWMAFGNGVLMINLLAANRALGFLRDGVERRRRRSVEPPG